MILIFGDALDDIETYKSFMVAFMPIIVILLALGIMGVIHFLLLLETAIQIQFYRRNADALANEFTTDLFEVIFIPLFVYLCVALSLTIGIHYLCLRSKATSFIEYYGRTLSQEGFLDLDVESLLVANPDLFNSLLKNDGFNKSCDRTSIIFEFQRKAQQRHLERIRQMAKEGHSPFDRWKEKLELALLSKEALVLACEHKIDLLQLLKDAGVEPVGERWAIFQEIRSELKEHSMETRGSKTLPAKGKSGLL